MKMLQHLRSIVDRKNVTITHAWFTTFSFSPAFFEHYVEAVICGIDPKRLTRLEDYELINSRLSEIDIRVFYDPAGLKTSEPKKTLATYIPIHCNSSNFAGMKGLFHPKVSLIIGTEKEQQKAWLMTGSANLTHSGWGRNRETLFTDELDQQNGKKIHDFFRLMMAEQLSEEQNVFNNWYRKLPQKDNPKWEFRYTLNRGTDDSILLDTLMESKKLMIWSPFFDNDVRSLLRNKLKVSGEICIVPDIREDGKVRISEKQQQALKECTFLRESTDKESERFAHGKMWVNEDSILIGSWNCSAAALMGHNMEAGVLIHDSCYDNFRERLKEIEDLIFLDDSEMKKEVAPEPVKNYLNCRVVANWMDRKYLIYVEENFCGSFILPGQQEEKIVCGLKQPVSVQIRDGLKLGKQRLFRVKYIKGGISEEFSGFIEEINTQDRPVYGYSDLRSCIDAFCDSNGGVQERNKEYLYGDSIESPGGLDSLVVSGSGGLNYYSLFFATENLKKSICETEDKEILNRLAYYGAQSVEQLVMLSEKWIGEQGLKKKVMAWFILNEVNGIVDMINEKLKANKITPIDKINPEDEKRGCFDELEKELGDKWASYVRG